MDAYLFLNLDREIRFRSSFYVKVPADEVVTIGDLLSCPEPTAEEEMFWDTSSHMPDSLNIKKMTLAQLADSVFRSDFVDDIGGG